MKFFHITTLCKIVGNQGTHSANSYINKKPDDVFNEYMRIYELCRSSGELYLKEENVERILLSVEVNHIQDVFRYSLKKLYSIWKENYPCNILYTGPDVLFTKPVSFSDKFDKFMMFNYTAGRHNKSTIGIEHYFNADIKYYPSTMDESLWLFALEKEVNWPSYDNWEYEQHIWNHMLWSQNISADEALLPAYAYQLIHHNNLEKTNDFNGIKIEDAKLIHFHNSGYLFEKYDIMKNIYDTYREKL